MSRSYGLTLARLKSVIATEQYNTKSVLQNEKKSSQSKVFACLSKAEIVGPNGKEKKKILC